MSQHPNYNPAFGGFAANREDLASHTDGTAFRHTSLEIDNSPAIPINGVSTTTVAGSLTTIAAYITANAGDGQGFISVPDGYDTWHNANGTINYDPTVPALDTFLNPIFSAILNNTALPAQYQRIKYGGIVLIPAGTYIVQNTINVPPGITLIGEGYGTKIINATSLTLSLPPIPKVSTTQAPLFQIKADPNRSSNDGSSNTFIFGRETAFVNLVIADNFVEPTILGDTYYKLPQNYNSLLVYQESGSSLTLDNIKFYGKVTFSSGQVVSQITGYAIGLSLTNPATNGSILRVKNCFIDGFGVSIIFSPPETNGDSNNYLEITNNKIRTYGYLGGDSSSISNNCIIQAAYTNIIATSNYFYGNASNIQVGIYVNEEVGPNPNFQNRLKVICSGNASEINKLSNVANATYQTITFFSGFSTYYSVAVSGNVFQGKSEYLSSTVNGPSSYTIDNNGFIDGIVFCNSATVGVITISLPKAAFNPGRMIVLKDNAQSAVFRTNNTTINTFSGDTIGDTGATSATLSSNGAVLRLVANGNSWWII